MAQEQVRCVGAVSSNSIPFSLYNVDMALPELGEDLWMKIFMMYWEEQRRDWWHSLSEVEREYEEWPVDPEEMAQGMYRSVFDV